MTIRLGGELAEDGVEVGTPGQELIAGLVAADFALRDHDDARAELADFLEDVGRDDDGLAGGHLLQDATHLELLVRIQAVSRFVKDEHLRVVDDCLGEAHAHAVAFGECVDRLRGDFIEATELERLADAFGRIGQATEIGGEAEEFPDGHLAVSGRAFRRVAQMLFGLDGLVGDVEARDDRGAFVGPEVTGQHLHRRRFTGTVGPKNHPTLTLGNREVQRTQNEPIASANRDIIKAQNRCTHRCKR